MPFLISTLNVGDIPTQGLSIGVVTTPPVCYQLLSGTAPQQEQ